MREDEVFDLAGEELDHYFSRGVNLAKFLPGYRDVRGRRWDGSKIGRGNLWWCVKQVFVGARAIVVFFAPLLAGGVPEVASRRGDLVEGAARSDAVAFADAVPPRLSRTTAWLLWSPTRVELVGIRGKRRLTLVSLWSGEDDSKPDIDTETGLMTWPDGSWLQLDQTDYERRTQLLQQSSGDPVDDLTD